MSARQDHLSFMCLLFIFFFILKSSAAVYTVQQVLRAEYKHCITGNSELGLKLYVSIQPFSNL